MSPELLVMQETYELNSFLRIGFGDEVEVVRIVGHGEDGVFVVGEHESPHSFKRYIKMSGGRGNNRMRKNMEVT